MTETEARNKWCPFGRAAVGTRAIGVEFMPHVPAFNRIAISDQQIMATQCVAGMCACWVEELAMTMTSVAHGHCGLVK